MFGTEKPSEFDHENHSSLFPASHVEESNSAHQHSPLASVTLSDSTIKLVEDESSLSQGTLHNECNNYQHLPLDRHFLNHPPNPTIKKNVTKRDQPPKDERTSWKKQKLNNFCKIYENRSEAEQAKTLLGYIVGNSSSSHITLSVDRVRKDQINFSGGVPCWLFDEDLNITVHESYMEPDAYTLLITILEAERKGDMDKKWICHSCGLLLGQKKSVRYDNCIKWYHQTCTGKTSGFNKKDTFFCHDCLSLKPVNGDV
ncbi:hypothetical protein QAD02_010735 [Eretmocerus hayati]|uniref:Uncharacterized protein n=1 Tax=Eretmocerus hayati TaxID=131215 RepID=A0ACC2NUN0_9HYME|nr:hypothetical protein QAD02_010735 [Eretmocerus hayati]